MDFREHLWLSCNKPFASRRAKREPSFMTTDHDHQREHGSEFMPKFDAAGLLSAVVVDAESREVLMLAFMDAEALA